MIQTVDQINDVNRHESELAAANQLNCQLGVIRIAGRRVFRGR